MKRRSSALFGLSALVALSLPPTAAQATAPTCFGKPATIVGTAGADTLTGTATASDVIFGGGGDDVIRGSRDYYDRGTAPDLLCGGPGDDRVLGSPGPDKLNGGDGNDYVNGNRGADVAQGNAGDDRVLDESLADADSENDIIRGGPGNDYLQVARGSDEAYGDDGNDVITDAVCGGSRLFGGPGNDTFESHWYDLFGYACTTGGDYVDGNDGSDRATVDRGDTVLRVETVKRTS